MVCGVCVECVCVCGVCCVVCGVCVECVCVCVCERLTGATPVTGLAVRSCKYTIHKHLTQSK